jgi:hypothetical protein
LQADTINRLRAENSVLKKEVAALNDAATAGEEAARAANAEKSILSGLLAEAAAATKALLADSTVATKAALAAQAETNDEALRKVVSESSALLDSTRRLALQAMEYMCVPWSFFFLGYRYR